MRASAVAGIIFANVHDELLGKLTSMRSMASVPFGGRYRLIDFSLSNLVNAGVSNVGIITKEKYHSLMDHVGSGVFWDLDRKNGGVHILPPYNISGARRYNDYVEALNGAMNFIKRCNAEYMVICNSFLAANVDISAAVKNHIENQADVTMVYRHGRSPENQPSTMLLSFDEAHRVNAIDFSEKSVAEVDYDIGIMIISRCLLIELIDKAYNSEATSISRDIIAKKITSLRIFGFRHEGFAITMDSERTYFKANMKLLEPSVRRDLFNSERPIFTKTRDDMPTRYGTKAKVENSFIADGCVINGTVKNSVLFRGVTVEKGAIIENSILMQGASVGQDTKLNYVVSDKNAVIGADMTLMGTEERSFMIAKNQTF